MLIYEPNTAFNKKYMFLGNTITVLTGGVTVLSWVIKFLVWIFSSKKIKMMWLENISRISTLIFLLGVSVLVFRVIIVAIKTKSQTLYYNRKIVEFLHGRLIHRVRNDIVELDEINNKLNNYVNNKEAVEECYRSELKMLNEKLKFYVDNLAQYLSNYRKDTISVCIKVFSKRDRNRQEYSSEKIITLVRSSNTEKERKSTKNSTVEENTDFINLCMGKRTFFGSSNLGKLSDQGIYRNDSENFKSGKYVSTLVTPIRYNDSSMILNNKRIKFDILGFLCIDSEKEIKEWENMDSFELQLMAIFSDILYVYIKEFYSCFERVGYLL